MRFRSKTIILHGYLHVGSHPSAKTTNISFSCCSHTSEQALYRLLRFFIIIRARSHRCSSSFAKSHARLICSVMATFQVACAPRTLRCRYNFSRVCTCNDRRQNAESFFLCYFSQVGPGTKRAPGPNTADTMYEIFLRCC